MSAGAFAAGPFHFVVDDGYTPLELGEALVQIAVEDFDERLLGSGRVPAIGPAPIASWVLARLEALSGEGGLGFSPGFPEFVDGGTWVLDFLVGRGAEPVGKVQLQGGMIGVGALGVLAPGEDPEAVVGALCEALLAAPEAVRPIEVWVVDPEQGDLPEEYEPEPNDGHVCRFGYDGEAYLGADNPVEVDGRQATVDSKTS